MTPFNPILTSPIDFSFFGGLFDFGDYQYVEQARGRGDFSDQIRVNKIYAPQSLEVIILKVFSILTGVLPLIALFSTYVTTLTRLGYDIIILDEATLPNQECRETGTPPVEQINNVALALLGESVRESIFQAFVDGIWTPITLQNIGEIYSQYDALIPQRMKVDASYRLKFFKITETEILKGGTDEEIRLRIDSQIPPSMSHARDPQWIERPDAYIESCRSGIFLLHNLQGKAPAEKVFRCLLSGCFDECVRSLTALDYEYNPDNLDLAPDLDFNQPFALRVMKLLDHYLIHQAHLDLLLRDLESTPATRKRLRDDGDFLERVLNRADFEESIIRQLTTEKLIGPDSPLYGKKYNRERGVFVGGSCLQVNLARTSLSKLKSDLGY